jgi:hypothetical protein
VALPSPPQAFSRAGYLAHIAYRSSPDAVNSEQRSNPGGASLRLILGLERRSYRSENNEEANESSKRGSVVCSADLVVVSFSRSVRAAGSDGPAPGEAAQQRELAPQKEADELLDELFY